MERLGLRPAKSLGQNFMVDPSQVRRIVAAARLTPGERVVEVGPGLGSLTLGLLEAGAQVTAVELDAALARALPVTVAGRAASAASRLTVLQADALDLTDLPGPPPTALVSNLPYSIATKVLLRFLERFESLASALVMVQAEVADRLVAPPGSRTYGIPSVKAAWWASARLAGQVPRSAFFPVPRVDSTLVHLVRRPAPDVGVPREQVFAVADAAFAGRRKTLRVALASLAGGAMRAERALRAAGIDPRARGETLSVEDFARLASELAAEDRPEHGLASDANPCSLPSACEVPTRPMAAALASEDRPEHGLASDANPCSLPSAHEEPTRPMGESGGDD
ncbi:MAG: 16S rRNA (adenine(1518)-N(6)/adenine(1519)-N(6))-dimethyltransferase RsmA [Bifidobacteriaceae bacterium]|nr:16S rRNA (adenine(1518)-N(6)/adenine(1519)-N(6))-dimethyltransferase RsmA [Bifidobacteriaceae bacterium]